VTAKDPIKASHKGKNALIWKNCSNLYAPDVGRLVLGVMQMVDVWGHRIEKDEKDVHLLLLHSRRLDRPYVIGGYNRRLTRQTLSSCPDMLNMFSSTGQLHFNQNVLVFPDVYAKESSTERLIRTTSTEGRHQLFALKDDEIVDLAKAILKAVQSSTPYYRKDGFDFSRNTIKKKLLAEFNVSRLEDIAVRFRNTRFNYCSSRERERITREREKLSGDRFRLQKSALHIEKCIRDSTKHVKDETVLRKFEESKALLTRANQLLQQAIITYSLTTAAHEEAYNATL